MVLIVLSTFSSLKDQSEDVSKIQHPSPHTDWHLPTSVAEVSYILPHADRLPAWAHISLVFLLKLTLALRGGDQSKHVWNITNILFSHESLSGLSSKTSTSVNMLECTSVDAVLQSNVFVLEIILVAYMYKCVFYWSIHIHYVVGMELEMNWKNWR